MNKADPENKPKPPRAEHGAPSEVTWEGGQGRQPYANREDAPVETGSGAHETEEGNQGELAGNNARQLDEVKRRP